MSFQICSDLHLNYWWGSAGLNSIEEVIEWIRQIFHPEINSPADLTRRCIILAGDVAPIEWEPLYLFLEALIICGYNRIIWIPGNHEFLSNKTSRKTIVQLERIAIERIKQINEKFQNNPMIYWVNRSILKYQDLQILGCTLWSIPDLTEPKVLNHHMFVAGEDPAKRFISSLIPGTSASTINLSGGSKTDPAFNLIDSNKYDSAIYSDDGNALTPQSYTDLARKDREWLLSVFNRNKDSSDFLLVITHYPPTRWMDTPENARDGKISMYTNDLSSEFFPRQVTMWISGHSHYTTRKFAEVDGRPILFLSNPIGYPREHKDKSREYHPEWTLDLS